MTANLDNNTAILLYTLFVTFHDTICYSYSITSLKLRIGLTSSKCFFCNFK